jgi:hypothetical protein
MWLRKGPVVGSGKQSNELWSFGKLDSSWLAGKKSVSEERLCFMELDIYYIYIYIYIYYIQAESISRAV